MKQVLIINPTSSAVYLAGKFKEAGVQSTALYVLDDSSVNAYSKYPRGIFDVELFMMDSIFDEILLALSEYNFEYIINGTERTLNLSDRLNAALLPHLANDPATSNLRSDKYAMHKALEQNNISHIYQHIIDLSNYDILAIKTEYPCFIKPLEGVGAIGAIKITNAIELEQYLSKTKLANVNLFRSQEDKDKYLLCEFVAGDEYLIDVFSHSGVHEVATVQSYSRELVDGAARCITLDAVSDKAIITKISEYISNVLDATGFKHGFSHNELFITPTGEMKLIEINPRISGLKGMASQIARLSSGHDQIDLFLQKIFNISLNPNIKYSNVTCYVLYNEGSRTTPDYTTVFANYPAVVNISQSVLPGSISVQKVASLVDSTAAVLVASNDINLYQDALAKIKMLESRVQ